MALVCLPTSGRLHAGAPREDRVALSDSCFEFLDAVARAAGDLACEIERYSESPLGYGAEIEALRQACARVKEAPWDPEVGAQLLRLASSVLWYLDTPPDTPEALMREAQMARLIQILQSNLDPADAQAVAALVQNVAAESGFTERAEERLKAVLGKLGKAAYDVAIKVVSDVASETAKKILGLKP